MKSNELSKNILRLMAVIAITSFLSACAGNASFSTSESSGSIQGYQSIRKPAVGQQWVYNVRDLYNNLVIDTITETVESVTPVIEIKRESKKHGQLVSEIQSGAGLALRDPYWNPPVNFINPMPMWPQSSDKSQTSVTRYKTGGDNVSSYYWSSTITFNGAETLNLDGKQFNTLKSNDWIYFVSNDFSRHTSMRTSTMWLAPEVGRWIIRVTDGSYLDSNTGIGGDRYESRLQYELVAYK